MGGASGRRDGAPHELALLLPGSAPHGRAGGGLDGGVARLDGGGARGGGGALRNSLQNDERRMTGKIRNPKAEIRRKSEIRRPKALTEHTFGFRASDFFRPSDFGLPNSAGLSA